MSRENVEIALEALRQFVEDGPDPDRWHEDGLLTAPDGWPEPGPFRGKAAINTQFERLVRDYSEFGFSDVEVIAESEDWVVIAFRWHTRGTLSGVAGAAEMAVAFKLRAGRFAEAHYRWQRQDALEAAGLSGRSESSPLS